MKKYKKTSKVSDIVKWGWKAMNMGFDHEGQDVFMKKCEVFLEDCMLPNVSSFRRKEAMFL